MKRKNTPSAILGIKFPEAVDAFLLDVSRGLDSCDAACGKHYVVHRVAGAWPEEGLAAFAYFANAATPEELKRGDFEAVYAAIETAAQRCLDYFHESEQIELVEERRQIAAEAEAAKRALLAHVTRRPLALEAA